MDEDFCGILFVGCDISSAGFGRHLYFLFVTHTGQQVLENLVIFLNMPVITLYDHRQVMYISGLFDLRLSLDLFQL